MAATRPIPPFAPIFLSVAADGAGHSGRHLVDTKGHSDH
jgi:hypothetical protein